MWIKVILAIILAFELPNSDGCKSSPPRRTRVQTTKRLGCIDQNGNKVARCTTRLDPRECQNGCPKDLLGWDCTTQKPYTWDLYTLVCGDISPEDCLKHILSSQSTCTPCCRVRGCEGTNNIKACAHIPHDDICPHNTIGCPLEDMLTIWETKERRRRKCSVDENCETIMDVSGDIANSGVNCWDTTRPKRQKSFCCNNRNVYTNVPICDGAPPAITTP